MVKNGRFLFFAVALSALMSLLVIRLLQLQVLQAAVFTQQAHANQEYRLTLPAIRGAVLDRYLEPLVINEQQYYQLLQPEKLFSAEQAIDRTAALQLIAAGQGNTLATRYRRWYPFGASLSHVLGYVGPVTVEDLAAHPELSSQDLIGKAGVEFVAQDELRGQPGYVAYQINALGQKQDVLYRTESEVGHRLNTTIDPWVSEVAHRFLQGKKGAFLLLNGENGEVLSSLSAPDFDPNAFQTNNQPEKKASVSGYLTDPQRPLFQRAIAGEYPPGSVFKIVTAMSGLDKGAINNETTVEDNGILQVGEFQYGNWYFRQYGRTEGAVDLSKALGRSNDIFFYKVAEWVGPESLGEYAQLFGFGQPTGIELSSEQSGVVPSPIWKRERFGQPWYLGNTYHFGIGQGDLTVTPVQIAQMTQILASGGLKCRPHVLSNTPAQCQSLSLKPEDIDQVIAGMIRASSAGGTAYPLFPYNAARQAGEGSVSEQLGRGVVAGKTGTAEFGSEDERGYHRTHGWYTMFAQLNEASTSASLSLDSASASAQVASSSASIVQQPSSSRLPTEMSLAELYNMWKKKVDQHGFPRKIVMTVLIESDETEPYREGSRDAAPIALGILQWLRGDTVGVK